MPRSTAVSGVERPSLGNIQITDELSKVLKSDLILPTKKDPLDVICLTPLDLARMAIRIGEFSGDGYGRFFFQHFIPTYDGDNQLHVTLRIRESLARLGAFSPYLLALDDRTDHAEIGIDLSPVGYQSVTVRSNKMFIDHKSEQSAARSSIREHFLELPSLWSRIQAIKNDGSAKLKAEDSDEDV